MRVVDIGCPVPAKLYMKQSCKSTVVNLFVLLMLLLLSLLLLLLCVPVTPQLLPLLAASPLPLATPPRCYQLSPWPLPFFRFSCSTCGRAANATASSSSYNSPVSSEHLSQHPRQHSSLADPFPPDVSNKSRVLHRLPASLPIDRPTVFFLCVPNLFAFILFKPSHGSQISAPSWRLLVSLHRPPWTTPRHLDVGPHAVRELLPVL